MTQTKPIPFSAPMVQALLREIEAPGTGKTQTRRIIKQASMIDRECNDVVRPFGDGSYFMCAADGTHMNGQFNCPHGKPGDLLYVRERWSGEHWFSNFKPSDRLLMTNENRLVSLIPETWYWADGSPSSGDWEKPRSGMHMPRWASRITLEVTDVRVQRLQDISEEDAKAEGVELLSSDFGSGYANYMSAVCADGKHGTLFASPVRSFLSLFQSINGEKIIEANPWLWAVTFTPHLINVDEFIKGRAAA